VVPHSILPDGAVLDNSEGSHVTVTIAWQPGWRKSQRGRLYLAARPA
jgi:hypothetical protein